MKPQAILGFPILLIFELVERRSEFRRFLLQTLLPAVAAFFMPILIVPIYLTKHEALVPFLSIIQDYYPLYSQLTGEHSSIAEGGKLGYMLKGYFQFGGFGWWWVPALFGKSLRG